MTTETLIKQVSDAAFASRDLDAAILKAIDPNVIATYQGTGHSDYATQKFKGSCRSIDIPHYTSSLDAAASLIPDGFDWILERTNGGLTISARVGHDDPDRSSWGNSPALALCAAALAARVAA